MGWGFSQKGNDLWRVGTVWSQSLSGWDGVFHARCLALGWGFLKVAIPFRVGWGFSRSKTGNKTAVTGCLAIPFRVEWGFSRCTVENEELVWISSQSLSGWDGVFHEKAGAWCNRGSTPLAIPFRVGWGFSQKNQIKYAVVWWYSQSLSGWDGVFHPGCRR